MVLEGQVSSLGNSSLHKLDPKRKNLEFEDLSPICHQAWMRRSSSKPPNGRVSLVGWKSIAAYLPWKSKSLLESDIGIISCAALVGKPGYYVIFFDENYRADLVGKLVPHSPWISLALLVCPVQSSLSQLQLRKEVGKANKDSHQNFNESILMGGYPGIAIVDFSTWRKKNVKQFPQIHPSIYNIDIYIYIYSYSASYEQCSKPLWHSIQLIGS